MEDWKEKNPDVGKSKGRSRSKDTGSKGKKISKSVTRSKSK